MISSNLIAFRKDRETASVFAISSEMMHSQILYMYSTERYTITMVIHREGSNCLAKMKSNANLYKISRIATSGIVESGTSGNVVELTLWQSK